MKFFWTILFSFCCAVKSVAQNDSVFQLVKTYPVSVADAALDNLDNLYLLTAQDQLKKFNAQGDSVAVYNNVRRLGKLYSMDVSNPLKLLLFYKDFSSIVLLDRFLAERGVVDLRRFNILQPTAAALSYDNYIWLFDAYDRKLKKINDQGTLLLETPDFRILFGEPFSPQHILDRDGWLYLYDPAAGILIFDYYGSFKRRLPLTNWSSMFINGNNILGIGTGALHRYSTTTLLETKTALPQQFLPYYHYSLSRNKLVAFSKDSLLIYSYRY